MKKKKLIHEIATQPSQYFTRGSRVEVRDEQGAWFPAQILDPNPNPNPSPFPLRYRKPRFLVQYVTLIAEDDASKPLTEEIDEAQLRPSPPEENAAEDFEENDVVDAFHMDGWWRGVVMRVEGERYTVGFKSPPDLLELRRGELRRHWDWRGGEWFPAKKETMMELGFCTPGEGVEVNIHKDCVWCVWIPANFLGPLGGNSFLVQYKSANNGNEYDFVKDVMSNHQIRPIPPLQEEREFELMDLVDAFEDMKWWVGDITKVLTGEKYVVQFRFPKEDKEFSRSDLRHHSEWIGHKWVTDRKALEQSMVNEEQSRYARSSYINHEEKTPTKSAKRQLSLFMGKSSKRKTSKKLLPQHPNDGATFSTPLPSKTLHGEHSDECMPLAALRDRAKSPGKTSKRNGPCEAGENSEELHVGQLDEATFPAKKRSRRQKSQADSLSPTGRRQKSQADSPSPSVRRQKSQVDSPSPSVRHGRMERRPKMHGKKVTGIGKAVKASEQILENEHVINGIESSGIGSEKGSEDSVRDGLAVASVVDLTLAWSGIHAKEPDHDRLSLLIKERDVNTTDGSTGTANHQNEASGREIETLVKADVEQEDSPKLPFVKGLPFWKNIESMEVFKKFPQKPHFHPLLETKEVFREGSAIGKMLAFASLVDQISKLQVGDPRDVIDSNLEATIELELHGFDANAIKRRLTELLNLKVKLEELQNQSTVVQTKFTERCQNKSKDAETISRIDKEIRELEANIKRLKENRAMAVSRCSAKDSSLSRLQSEAEAITEGIQSIQHDFEMLAAAPL